jgi:dolichol-phosphate mannosyltransferase
MVSIIIPAFNEEKNLYNNLIEIINVINIFDYELVLVDDGSRDLTWEIIKKISKENNKIKGIKFSRNFGKEAALFAGLENSKGDAVIIMDSDLQHPPKYIPEMIEKWQEGYKIVECKKEKRIKESIINKLGANIFYETLKRIAGYDLANACDYKLLDRQVVNDIINLKEGHTFFRGLVEWVGYEKYQITINIPMRCGDKSKFNMIGLTKLALTAITSFSSSLLYLTIVLGMLFIVGALILGIHTLINKIVGNALTGFTTVILLLLIIGGCILFCLGIIGLYIAKIYDEVKGRPRYIISERGYNTETGC